MADDVTVVVVRNDLQALAVQLRAEAEQAVAAAANQIEAAMKSGSDRIASTVRTRSSRGGLTATVTAGDRARAIHAGFEEYGTVGRPAHPFATPAAEDARPEWDHTMRDLLKRGL